MAYSSADDAFKIREPKKGDQSLQAFLNSDTEVTHVTSSVGLPVAVISGGPSGYALEATQLSVLAAVDTLESLVDGLETLIASTNTKLDTIAARVLHGPPGPGGDLAVTAAGTAEQLPSTACTGCLAKVHVAVPGDFVYIGDATVDSSVIPWADGTVLVLDCTNLNQIWVDADSNNDGIYYQALGA